MMETQIVSNKGNAPKITPEIIEAEIVGTNYFTAAEGALGAGQPHTPSMELLTLCVITLRNGFLAIGQSKCASPANFDKELGQKYAYEDAFRKLWEPLGYQLLSQLHRIEEAGDKLGEALTRMLAHRLGNPEAFRPEDAELIMDHVTDDGSEEQIVG